MRRLHAGAEEHAVQFSERNAPRHARTAGFILHIGNVELFQVDFAVIEVISAADAFGRHIGFRHGKRIRTLRLRRIDIDRHRIACAENIVLREACRQNDAFRRGVAGAERNGASRTLLHIHFKVDLIARARHRLRFCSHTLEVAETVNTVARELDFVAVEPGGFVLTDFTADDFVMRAVVAGDIHAADISAASRIDRINDIDRTVFRIGNRIGVG